MGSKSSFLDFLSLQVRNINTSKEYYTNVLGFTMAKVQPQPEHAVVFENEAGASFAIRLPIGNLDKSEKLGTGAMPWFAVMDVQYIFDNIKKHNGKLLQVQPQEGPFGKFFNTIDPDGYVLTFHQIKD
jgi:lactoylglutathione lyase